MRIPNYRLVIVITIIIIITATNFFGVLTMFWVPFFTHMSSFFPYINLRKQILLLSSF